MRLITENKLILLLLVSFVFLINACRYISENKLIEGHWQFNEVTMNDSSLFALTDTDFINFKTDSFHYEIASVRKSCSGTWTYNNHLLKLKYNVPDTTRLFEVEIISKRDLVFREGDVLYSFKSQE